MSLTNEDAVRLKDVADNLKSENIAKGPSKVFSPIQEYAFDNPMELANMLERMWAKLDKSAMKKFVPIVVASAFKNREKQEEIVLSPFNYQF